MNHPEPFSLPRDMDVLDEEIGQTTRIQFSRGACDVLQSNGASVFTFCHAHHSDVQQFHTLSCEGVRS